MLIVLDTFTFGQIESLSTANARAWEEIGLEGTWTQTISSGAALVARETLIAAATMGTGSAIQTVRGTAGVGRAVQQMNNAGRIGRFFNTTRSSLGQGLAARVGGTQAGQRGLQAANWAGRGYNAYQSIESAREGYQMLQEGNQWGWLAIGGAGLHGLTAGAGGFRVMRHYHSAAKGYLARRVRELSATDLRVPRRGLPTVEHIPPAKPGTITLGTTDPIGGKITIQRGLSRDVRRATYLHELVHQRLALPSSVGVFRLLVNAVARKPLHNLVVPLEEMLSEGYSVFRTVRMAGNVGTLRGLQTARVRAWQHAFGQDLSGSFIYNVSPREFRRAAVGYTAGVLAITGLGYGIGSGNIR